MNFVEASDVEKSATKSALKSQLQKMASKGVESLLNPDPADDKKQGIDAEKQSEVEGIFANGSKVRVVVEDEMKSGFWGKWQQLRSPCH